MESISNFPYFEVQFNKSGQINSSSEVQKLLDFLAQQRATDLFVISHGWNNNMNEARQLYQKFFVQIRQIMDDGEVSGIGTRKFAILAVLWPSKKFAEQNLIPGGAASLDSSKVDAIEKQLTILQELIAESSATPVFEQLKTIIPDLEMSPSKRQEFADLVRSVVTPGSADTEDASALFFQLDGKNIMERLNKPIFSQFAFSKQVKGGADDLDDVTSGSSGEAAGWFDQGFTVAARNLLNFTTYYTMKQRAGTVGLTGLNPLLQKIRTQYPALKLHLVGHSFGGRLVTAAALGTGELPALKIETMSLLQTAFSHYGFAKDFEGSKDGFFRKVVENKGISGPILISHSKKDIAVGIAYPIASALAQDNATDFGDENDRFGGLGRNGAQRTKEAIKGLLLSVGSIYQFQSGKLHNLQADDIIEDHSDICKPQVAYAILTAVGMT
jgi:hypothetical protein